MCTSALPWRQQSDLGLRVIQDAYFSLLIHNKQLLLVTFCDTLAGIEVRFGHTELEPRSDRQNHGWTDRRGSRNSYLDRSFASCRPSKIEFVLQIYRGGHMFWAAEKLVY